MLARCFCLFTLLGLVVLPSAVPAADTQDTAPVLQVRLRSLDGLLEDAKFVASLADPDAGKQIDELIKNVFPKGFEGIDTKKPLGFSIAVDPNSKEASKSVAASEIFVPITDERAYIAMLETTSHLQASKDGAYFVFKPSYLPVAGSVYVRFSEGYACITVSEKRPSENGKFTKPSAFFAQPQTTTANVQLQFARIPAELKTQASSAIEAALRQIGGAQVAAPLITSLLEESAELTIDLDASARKEAIGLKLNLTGTPKSSLAALIAGMGQKPSLFAGWIKKGSAANFLFHVKVPESGHRILDFILDSALQGPLGPVNELTNNQLRNTLTPTVKAGEVDFAFDWRGPTPEGFYGGVFAFRVVDADKIEKLIKDGVAQSNDPAVKLLKFDANSKGAAHQIHRFIIPEPAKSELVRIYGENPIYFAFRKDAVLIAMGEGGLTGIGEALEAKPHKAVVAAGEINLSKLIPQIKLDDRNAESRAKKAMVKPGSDFAQFTLKGGNSLQFEIEVKSPLLRYFSQMLTGDRF